MTQVASTNHNLASQIAKEEIDATARKSCKSLRTKLGRQQEDLTGYVLEANKQVQEWREELHAIGKGQDTESRAQRSKLRNKISALRHRIKVKS